MTQAFPRYIHVYTDPSVLDCSSGPAFLRPRLVDGLVDGLELPLTLELLGGGYDLQRQWLLPAPVGFSLELTLDGYVIKNRSGREIPPLYTAEAAKKAPWPILRLSVADPEADPFHGAYVPVFPDQEARRLWEAHGQAVLAGLTPETTAETALAARVKTVHITARNIVPRDAVSNFALGLAGLLSRAGLAARLYAHDTSPAYAGLVSPVGSLPHVLRPGDTLFCNYSITDEFFPRLSALPCARKILYFHNVTPGQWFRPYDAAFAGRLDQARGQYPGFAGFDALLANSRFSLESVRPYARAGAAGLAFPPFLSLHRLDEPAAPPALPPARHTLLWVGRLAPHKRPELALSIFDALAKLGQEAALVFVGGGRNDLPAFAALLEERLAALPRPVREKVVFLENLSDGQLASLYRKASLLFCTSAHEGYCLPLAEAAAFGLPVAVLPQPAVLETLNGGGLILDEAPKRAAEQIKGFLEGENEAARSFAIPKINKPPLADLLALIAGE